MHPKLWAEGGGGHGVRREGAEAEASKSGVVPQPPTKALGSIPSSAMSQASVLGRVLSSGSGPQFPRL